MSNFVFFTIQLSRHNHHNYIMKREFSITFNIFRAIFYVVFAIRQCELNLKQIYEFSVKMYNVFL